MVSIAFPDMLKNNKTQLYEGHKATAENLRLMLASHKTGLFGDPYYGTNLKRLIFDQNNSVLRDVVIDDIYTSIMNFMPQVVCNRNDISITSDGVDVFVTIKCVNRVDFDTNLYTINLVSGEIQ